MKKIVSLLAAALVFTGISASAQDNTHIYGEFVSKTLIPQKGICDVQKSYSGHENEDINDYFSGLISAFTVDIDSDGSDERSDKRIRRRRLGNRLSRRICSEFDNGRGRVIRERIRAAALCGL